MRNSLSINAIAEREGVSPSDIRLVDVRIAVLNGNPARVTVYRVRRRGLQRIFSDFVNVHAIDDPRLRLVLQAAMVKVLCSTGAPLPGTSITLRDKLFDAWSAALCFWKESKMDAVPFQPRRETMMWSAAEMLSTILLHSLPNSEGYIVVTPHRRADINPGEVLLLDDVASVRQYVTDLQETVATVPQPPRTDWWQLAAWSRLFGPQFANIRWSQACRSEQQTKWLLRHWLPHFDIHQF